MNGQPINFYAFLLQLAPFVVGLGGIIISGIMGYLAYKGKKTSLYREALYLRQLEGYAEVMEAFTTFYKAGLAGIITLAQGPGLRLDENNRNELRRITLDENQAFYKAHKRWAIFLPKDFNDALHKYIAVFNGITAHPEATKGYPKEHLYARDPQMLLANAYGEVVEAARKGVGTEALSKETLHFVGESPEKPVGKDTN